MLKISVPISVIEQSEFYIKTYTSCQTLVKTSVFTEYFFSIEVLSRFVPDVPKSELEKAVNSFSFVKKHYGKVFSIDKDAFHTDENFVSITYEEYEKLATAKMLKFYLALLATRDVTTKCMVGHMPISYLSKRLSISDATTRGYLTKLEECGLIYVCRVNGKDGQTHNYYGKMCDREYIDVVAAQNGVVANQIKTNQHRSIVQRYNRFIKSNCTCYDNAQIMQLIADIEAYNKDMERLQLTQQGSDYVSRKKDISVLYSCIN